MTLLQAVRAYKFRYDVLNETVQEQTFADLLEIHEY